LTVYHSRSETLYRERLVGNNRAAAIHRLSKCVYDSADHSLAYRNFHDSAGTFNLIAFANFCVLTKQNDADLALFQVQREAHNLVGKREELARHYALQTMNASDAITDGNYGTDFAHIDSGAITINLLADNLADLVCFDLHAVFQISINLE
jgi:hypothetical protein